MRYIYNIIFFLFIPFELLRLIWRSFKNPDYRKRIFERFNIFNIPKKYENAIWFHAVSVGETIASAPIIKELQKRYPEIPIVITTTTPTGSNRVKEIFKETVFHVYVPYDLPFIVKKFLKKVKPRLVIIMEKELWPNIIHYSNKLHIPIIIANAIISERSFTKYSLLKNFTKKMLQNVTIVAVQSKDIAEKFQKLGITQEKIQILGNVKFDSKLPETTKENGQILREQIGVDRKVWIAASTHKGEDEIILKAFDKIKEKYLDSVLLLILRHPERVEDVISLCKKSKYKFITRSSKDELTKDIDILIGDTIGEMMTFYAASDVALVCGSLIPEIGGHNPLEPAMLELPILIGKYTFNMNYIIELFKEANAIVIVKDYLDIANNVIKFFDNNKLREEFGKRAKSDVVDPNNGAVEAHLALIQEFLAIRSKK